MEPCSHPDSKPEALSLKAKAQRLASTDIIHVLHAKDVDVVQLRFWLVLV